MVPISTSPYSHHQKVTSTCISILGLVQVVFNHFNVCLGNYLNIRVPSNLWFLLWCLKYCSFLLHQNFVKRSTCCIQICWNKVIVVAFCYSSRVSAPPCVKWKFLLFLSKILFRFYFTFFFLLEKTVQLCLVIKLKKLSELLEFSPKVERTLGFSHSLYS